MASAGKKNKKNKQKSIRLQDFLSNGNEQPGLGHTQVIKRISNYNEEGEEEDLRADSVVVNFQLPTGPRSIRYNDDSTVPHDPPFTAYVSNLPFDITEENIEELFISMSIVEMKLPRNDEESTRVNKGYGYVTFETRKDLINALSLSDPHIRNRRVRVELTSENDQQKRGMGNRSRYDGFGGNSNSRESTDWRNKDRSAKDNDRDDNRRGGYGYNRDRAPRDNSQETGSWRTGDRPHNDSASPARRGGGGGGGGGGFGEGFRDRFGGRRGQDNYRRDDNPQQERPKLNLAPRTLPVPERKVMPEDDNVPEVSEKSASPEPVKPKPAGVTAEKVFGSAKPVDTAAREKAIEERLERERQEKLKKMEEEKLKEQEECSEEKSVEDQIEKEEKENKNSGSWRKRDDERIDDTRGNYRKSSPDRRLLSRKIDDRRGGGNMRDNQRDRRDFNRGSDRDNNKYRDNRDRNERPLGRENFNRDRPFNKDGKDFSRENMRDNKVQQQPRQEEKPPRRDNRAEKPMPKYQPPQGGPVLSNSNKYSFLDEDGGASE